MAFVTGGSKGIGREVARTLANEGCDVVITARGQEELEKTAAELSEETGRRVVAEAGDMSRSEDVDRCVRAAIDELGAIDILVTCAGSSPGGLLEELTDERVDAEPEPQVHGLCPHRAGRHPPHGAARQRFRGASWSATTGSSPASGR